MGVKVTYTVGGMMCGGCTGAMTKLCTEMEGVASCEVTLATLEDKSDGKVMLEIADGADKEAVKAAFVAKLGSMDNRPINGAPTEA